MTNEAGATTGLLSTLTGSRAHPAPGFALHLLCQATRPFMTRSRTFMIYLIVNLGVLGSLLEYLRDERWRQWNEQIWFLTPHGL